MRRATGLADTRKGKQQLSDFYRCLNRAGSQSLVGPEATYRRNLYRNHGDTDVQHDKGHGRIETRTVHTFDLPPNWLPDDWQALVRQVARVSRTVERRKPGGWHTTDETAWWISTTALSAPAFRKRSFVGA